MSGEIPLLSVKVHDGGCKISQWIRHTQNWTITRFDYQLQRLVEMTTSGQKAADISVNQSQKHKGPQAEDPSRSSTGHGISSGKQFSRAEADHFLIFLHIQKTAGITLQRVFRRKLGPSLPVRFAGLFRKSSSMVQAGSEPVRMARDRYYAGHNCWGIHRSLPQPYFYLTFLRHPVSRLISLYHYSHENESAYYHSHAKGRTIEQFLLETELHELDNGQVRVIAGDDKNTFTNSTPFGQCDKPLLDLALKHVEEDFLLVGLTEYFDESFLLLCDRLGWGSTRYLSRNRSTQKRAQPSQSLLAELERRNAFDIEFYELMRKRLEQQIEAAGLRDDGRLETFRRRNARFQRYFGPVYDLYGGLKSKLRGYGTSPH
jgi:hypothetical protein